MGQFDSLSDPPAGMAIHKYEAIIMGGDEMKMIGLVPSLKPILFNQNVFITQVQRYPTCKDLVAIKLTLAVELGKEVRSILLEELKGREVDFALFDESEYHSRQIKLAAFDMDSCILGHECIDELAGEMGVSERVKDITSRAMAGELDFNDALKERVALLQGMKGEQMEQVWLRLHLNPGAVSLIKTLKSHGVKVALVSGGFTYFAHRVAARLGIDYAFSNTLEFDANGLLTGRVVGEIVNGNVKESIKQTKALADKLQLSMHNVITMGDGANDQYMIRAAGIGIAYHGKSVLKNATPHHIDFSPLNSLLPFANFPVEDEEVKMINNYQNDHLASMPVFDGFPVMTSLDST